MTATRRHTVTILARYRPIYATSSRRVRIRFSSSAPGTYQKLKIRVGTEAEQEFPASGGIDTPITIYKTFGGTSTDLTVRIRCETSGAGSMSVRIYEVDMEVEYQGKALAHAATGVEKSGTVSKEGSATKTGAVTKTGAATKTGVVTRSGVVTLSGNSVADVRVGKIVTVHVDGYRDDGAGTYTGTPDALIERPDHVFKHIWCELLGAPSGDIDSTTFTAAGTFFATNSYAFSIVIDEPVQADTLLMRLALQCRSRFFVTAYGKAKLIVRELGQASGHAIAKNEIKYDSMLIRRSATEDLINYFHIHYNQDRTKSRTDPAAYLGVKKFADAVSISRYGQREWRGAADLFYFDAVASAMMVEHVGDFLLDYHKAIRKMPCFAIFLDNMETAVEEEKSQSTESN